jgi:hypothetical protein
MYSLSLWERVRVRAANSASTHSHATHKASLIRPAGTFSLREKGFLSPLPKYLRRKTSIFQKISPKIHPFCAAGITTFLTYYASVNGNPRKRFPLIEAIAFEIAGATGGRPTSPIPPGWLSVGITFTLMRGVSLARSTW